MRGAYIYTYLGEDLDVVADLDKVHLLVKPEDVHPRPRAAGVEDHSVLAGRRRRVLCRLVDDDGDPAG